MVHSRIPGWSLLVVFVMCSIGVTLITDASRIGLDQRPIVTFAILSLLAWYFFWAELKLSGTFPRSEFKWVLGWHLVTIPPLAFEIANSALGLYGCLCLGVFGAIFMAYVNLRFGAPVVFDYVLPLPNLLLAASTISQLAFVAVGITLSVAIILYVVLFISQFLRTLREGKLPRLKARFYGLELC